MMNAAMASNEDKTGEAGRGTKKSRSHQSGSFLVRFWVEPEAGPGEQALRGSIKNLQTGQEHYLNDPGKIGELVRQHLGDKEGSQEAVPEAKAAGTERS
jgi:hypothetical protein